MKFGLISWGIHSEIAPVTTEKWQNLIHPDDLKQSNLKKEDCFDQK
jgi:hypothetical protein